MQRIVELVAWADLTALGWGYGIDETATIGVDERMRMADGLWAIGDITVRARVSGALRSGN